LISTIKLTEAIKTGQLSCKKWHGTGEQQVLDEKDCYKPKGKFDKLITHNKATRGADVPIFRQ